jgi:hypothetical protein
MPEATHSCIQHYPLQRLALTAQFESLEPIKRPRWVGNIERKIGGAKPIFDLVHASERSSFTNDALKSIQRADQELQWRLPVRPL